MAQRTGARRSCRNRSPPIIGTAVTAWEDAFRVIAAMPLVAGIAFVIVILLSLASFWLIPHPGSLTEPLAAGIHSRFERRKRRAARPARHRGAPLCAAGRADGPLPARPFQCARYVRFVGFAVLVNVLWSLPSVDRRLHAGPAADSGRRGHRLGSRALRCPSSIVIVVVRRVILFPAVAVDAPGATWSNARRDTKGSSWRVAFILSLRRAAGPDRRRCCSITSITSC